jgi:hypothetical protein
MIDAKKLIVCFGEYNPKLKLIITEAPGEIIVESKVTGYVHRRSFDKHADQRDANEQWFRLLLDIMAYGMAPMPMSPKKFSIEDLRNEIRPLWMRANCGAGDPSPDSPIAIEVFNEWFDKKYNNG